jgi:hypothetical protein
LVFGKRVTIVVGHFGSGKTEIAVNGALKLAAGGVPVSLVDLDVVKPYFRSRATRAVLAERGVSLVVPTGENIFADLPIIVPQVRALLRDERRKVLFDVGGDDTGARVLGSLADVVPVDETDHLQVLNFRRPFTETVEAAVTMVREIEQAARLAVTGVISNTHLMGETTPEIVADGYRMAAEVAGRVGVPVVAVVAERGVAARLDPALFACPLFVLERLIRPQFDVPRQQRSTGPLFVLT